MDPILLTKNSPTRTLQLPIQSLRPCKQTLGHRTLAASLPIPSLHRNGQSITHLFSLVLLPKKGTHIDLPNLPLSQHRTLVLVLVLLAPSSNRLKRPADAIAKYNRDSFACIDILIAQSRWGGRVPAGLDSNLYTLLKHLESSSTRGWQAERFVITIHSRR